MEYKYSFGFLLKSYRVDIEVAKRLAKSFITYNIEKNPLFIVVPKEDVNLFEKAIPKKPYIFIINEEDIPVEYAKGRIANRSQGYINQEIVKLAFWETGLCKNYCCLDSDAYFIDSIRKKRFMYDEDVPYTVLREDNDLKADRRYYKKHWINREKSLKKIYKFIGLKDEHIITCHGLQTFSASVLEDFKRNFLEKNNYNYVDILRIAPYEFTWYNAWLLKTNVIPLHICEPHFKGYHMKHQYIFAKLWGCTEEDIKRSYVGVVLNSNYFGHSESFVRKVWKKIVN